MIVRILSVVFFALIAGMAATGDAKAQATRTWVSGVGDDVNPCSRTAPCKTFAGAISKTASGGEISVLDPGGFGTLTITKPISIVAIGDLGSVLSAGTNGFTISSSFAPAGGRVFLKGLEIDGAGTGINGVNVLGPAQVFLEDVIIRNVTQNGVTMNGPAGARVLLNRVTITNAAQNGLALLGAAANVAFVTDSTLDTNGVSAINVGAVGTAVISGSTLSGSGNSDLTVAAGGQAISYGNNLIRNGTPTSTALLK